MLVSNNSIMPPRHFLLLTVAMMTALILLINVSFKIIVVRGVLFTASSVLCPLVAGLYLLVLKDCNLQQQRQVLNQCLLALYLFSIGIYLLVNLPAADNMRDTVAYQIIFEDIPKKFFAATLAFAFSFYLPHFYLCSVRHHFFDLARNRLLLTLAGGLFFFMIDFILLFSGTPIDHLLDIYSDSMMMTTGLLLLIGLAALYYLLCDKSDKQSFNEHTIASYFLSPVYHYLIGFSVTILMICLACEYRLIGITSTWVLAVSGLLLPFALMASTLVNELYGYKANIRLIMILWLSEIAFDLCLMLIVALPSPSFFNLNPFYLMIMPRRIPAATLSLCLTFGSNAILLEKLKHTVYGSHRGLRIFIANVLASIVLCLVNYTILFSGIFPYEQVFNLALSAFAYKFIVILLCLPCILWMYSFLKKINDTADMSHQDSDNY